MEEEIRWIDSAQKALSDLMHGMNYAAGFECGKRNGTPWRECRLTGHGRVSWMQGFIDAIRELTRALFPENVHKDDVEDHRPKQHPQSPYKGKRYSMYSRHEPAYA